MSKTNSIEEIKEMANNFRSIAELYDQIVVLAEKEENGENIDVQTDEIMGKIMVKFMKINGSL